jgi:hypothetical protein
MHFAIAVLNESILWFIVCRLFLILTKTTAVFILFHFQGSVFQNASTSHYMQEYSHVFGEGEVSVALIVLLLFDVSFRNNKRAFLTCALHDSTSKYG